MGIKLKERIIIFKQYRELFEELKKDFFEAKSETELNVLNYFNYLVVCSIFLVGELIALILCFFKLPIVASVIAIISFVYFLLATKTKLFKMTGFMSYKLLFYLFGRYGKVVNRKDWENIKNYNKKRNKKYAKKFYKFLTSKKSKGKCYYCSWFIAQFLQAAQIMYCSIELSDGPSGHAVIVKNNCVYDTNDRRHYDYDEYIELYDVNVYKMFSESEYRKASFFDDIRDGFVEWCAKNNVYCDPE